MNSCDTSLNSKTGRSNSYDVRLIITIFSNVFSVLLFPFCITQLYDFTQSIISNNKLAFPLNIIIYFPKGPGKYMALIVAEMDFPITYQGIDF